MKLTKDSAIVIMENGTVILSQEAADLDAAKKFAAEAVTRTDRAYGKVVFIMTPSFKVEMPAPPAEITNL